MSKLTDERKRQIRAEEEARAQKEAEEKYRAEVRKEIGGGAGPVTTVRGHAPGPKAAPPERSPTLIVAKPSRRGAPLVAVGALAIALGIVLLILGLTRKAPRDPDEEIVADGSGALAPTAKPWNPADLGYPTLAYKDGVATETPATGTSTLGALKKQADEVPQIGTGGGPPPPPPPATAGALDALLVHVPADAFAVVALDLDKTRGSRALMDVLDTLVRQTGLADRVGPLSGAGAIVIAGVPSAPRQDPWPVVVVRDASGTLRVVAAPEIQDTAMAVSGGGNVLDSGGLRDALASVRSGPAGFAAIRMVDDARAELAQMLAGLEKIQWLAGTLDTSAGIVLSGSAVFPDDTSAASVAMAVNVGKSLAKSQLPAQVAVAIDKMAFTAMGNTVKVSARWTEADVAALSAAVR